MLDDDSADLYVPLAVLAATTLAPILATASFLAMVSGLFWKSPPQMAVSPAPCAFTATDTALRMSQLAFPMAPPSTR